MEGVCFCTIVKSKSHKVEKVVNQIRSQRLAVLLSPVYLPPLECKPTRAGISVS